MNSTQLAHALKVDPKTPGCWAGHCKKRSVRKCVWPMPNSGKPGAEFWFYWLMQALRGEGPSFPHVSLNWNGEWCYGFFRAKTPVEVVYLAWLDRKNKVGATT